MYEVASGKRMYTFPAREHTSSITALHFTPQGRVVSAGKEPSIRVWIVGKDGARVEHRIDSRSGEVAMPGVTDDGSRLLLDADKSHLDVIHLEEMRKERPLVTGEAIRFSTFTAWSPELDKKPDNRLVATTGAADGVVQLWRAPTAEDRGTEVARLVTRESAAAMCAAFSPQAENGFVVVGTRKGYVHLWPLPKATDVPVSLNSTVTHVEPLIDSSGRTVNVLVDFDNPPLPGNKHLLRPGSAVSLVIRPAK
jgi:WD40 repeat protein